jgi:hypothetical protein
MEEKLPRLPTRLVTHPPRRRGDTPARFYVFDCPWCGREHWHSPEPGHRLTHCHAPAAPREYVLLRPGEAP